jgi:hypothetical protein
MEECMIKIIFVRVGATLADIFNKNITSDVHQKHQETIIVNFFFAEYINILIRYSYNNQTQIMAMNG